MYRWWSPCWNRLTISRFYLFFHNFKNACDSKDIHGCTTMRILQHFIKDHIKAAWPCRVCDTKKDELQKEGRLTTNCRVVSYLLTICVTDNVLAKAEAAINNFKLLEWMYAVCSSENLWERHYTTAVCMINYFWWACYSGNRTNQFAHIWEQIELHKKFLLSKIWPAMRYICQHYRMNLKEAVAIITTFSLKRGGRN